MDALSSNTVDHGSMDVTRFWHGCFVGKQESAANTSMLGHNKEDQRSTSSER